MGCGELQNIDFRKFRPAISNHMTSFMDGYGPWALVCGSADGLGAAYSRALAKRGLNLIMVDFQPKKLETLRHELEEAHGP
jgi:NADP-dependent 3-hydroxy acid dehydrogenase YdfG